MTTYLNYGLSDITRAIEEGKEAEQARIIKLIEAYTTKCPCDPDCLADNEITPSEIIELIKGETND